MKRPTVAVFAMSSTRMRLVYGYFHCCLGAFSNVNKLYEQRFLTDFQSINDNKNPIKSFKIILKPILINSRKILFE